MRRIFKVLLLVLCLGGCDMSARQIQAHTADGVAQAANAALPILLDRYRQDGLDAIAKAETKADAEAALAAVKTRWEPLWKSWEAVRIAQNSWASALEAGKGTAAALAAVRSAYCGLQEVWPATITALPVVPISCLESKEPTDANE